MRRVALDARPRWHRASDDRRVAATPGRVQAVDVVKIPKRLQPLVDEGVIDGVVRQLMSGKEAMVFVVRCGDETRCAKVYKEADKRSFRQAVDYTENRKTKNTPPGARHGQGHALRPQGAGARVAERRGRRAVPARRRRRARAASRTISTRACC